MEIYLLVKKRFIRYNKKIKKLLQFALKSDIIYSLWNRMQGGANMPNIKSAKKRVLIAEANYLNA